MFTATYRCEADTVGSVTAVSPTITTVSTRVPIKSTLIGGIYTAFTEVATCKQSAIP